MSRYYFHSVTSDGLFIDDIGVEVDDSALQREARMAIFELERELMPRGEAPDVLGFRVVDDLGRTVLELPLHERRDDLH